jgi:signal transduction histidine kinase
VVAAAAVSGLVAVAFATIPQLQFAYFGVPIRIALETAASLIALFASFLVYGRLRRYRGTPELLLAVALAMLALVNLCLLVTPLLPLPRTLVSELLGWVQLAGRGLAAALFALAAFGPSRRLGRPGLALAGSVAAGAVALLAPMVLLAGGGSTARRLAAALVPATPGPPALLGSPLLVALPLATAVVYGAATVGFFRRSRLRADQFLGWVAASGMLAAASNVNAGLYPSPGSGLIHASDLFRLCFYVTLLAGSMREIWCYWLALSRAAVLEERQRIARDLHDGLAQELACVARNLDALDRTGQPLDGGAAESLGLLRAAVGRAQAESRRAVGALAAASADPVEVAVAEAAVEVAQRLALELRLDLACGTEVPAARRDALVRIATEAITNVARHSGASEVHLALERDGPLLRLRVTDRGRGFDPAAAGDGFGLTSLRQRAQSAGGELRISSATGAGSEVEAAF